MKQIILLVLLFVSSVAISQVKSLPVKFNEFKESLSSPKEAYQHIISDKDLWNFYLSKISECEIYWLETWPKIREVSTGSTTSALDIAMGQGLAVQPFSVFQVLEDNWKDKTERNKVLKSICGSTEAYAKAGDKKSELRILIQERIESIRRSGAQTTNPISSQACLDVLEKDLAKTPIPPPPPSVNASCSFEDGYFVRKINQENSNGENVYIYQKNNQATSPAACKDGKYGKPLLTIEDQHWFFHKIKGDLVFMEAGTAPGSTGLRIRNIKNGNLLFNGDYVDFKNYKFLDENTLELWIQESGVAGCTTEEIQKNDSYELGSVTVRRHTYDFRTKKLQKTNDIECMSTQ